MALSSVVVLTIAALIGTSQGLTSARQSDRHEAAVRTAEAGAAAYEQAGAWSGARLDTASAIAGAAGARALSLHLEDADLTGSPTPPSPRTDRDSTPPASMSTPISPRRYRFAATPTGYTRPSPTSSPTPPATAARATGSPFVHTPTPAPASPPTSYHIFQRLWRGQHAKAVTGSGIGLAVVREPITAHAGTVTANSTAGAGTTTIRLPLAAPSVPTR